MICKLVFLISAFIIAESADISISASETKFHKGDNITFKCDFSLKSSEALNYLTISVNNKEFYRYNHEDQSKHFSISRKKLKDFNEYLIFRSDHKSSSRQHSNSCWSAWNCSYQECVRAIRRCLFVWSQFYCKQTSYETTLDWSAHHFC
jgi:hypothetical protein